MKVLIGLNTCLTDKVSLFSPDISRQQFPSFSVSNNMILGVGFWYSTRRTFAADWGGVAFVWWAGMKD